MRPSLPLTLADRTTPRLFAALTVAFVLAALVPTVWTDVDLQAAALFAGPTARLQAVHWGWVAWINAWVPALFRVCLVIALAAWLVATLQPRWQAWRLPLAFVVVAGVMGPGIVVNWGFKDNWQRARPYQVQEFGGTQQFTRAAVMTDQCDNNCSFVSGHVACGFFWVSLMLVHRRRQIGWATGGLLVGGAVGFARMSDMAHWLSDVLWAGPITLLCSWFVWKVLQRVYADSTPATH